MRFPVYESDITEKYYDIDEDYYLGEITLYIAPGQPKGSPIELVMTLNNEGILEIESRDPVSGNSERVQLKTSGDKSMSAEKLAAAKAKSNRITVE